MAIKSLKSTISICEIQKMRHQWKIGNLYQICLALKTVHTSDLLDYIKKCKSFELVWNENKAELLAFFTPLWHSKTTDFVSPTVSSAETNSKSDNNIINNNILYNIYPSENPDGSETQNYSFAKEFFRRINATPEEKKLVLASIIIYIILFLIFPTARVREKKTWQNALNTTPSPCLSQRRKSQRNGGITDAYVRKYCLSHTHVWGNAYVRGKQEGEQGKPTAALFFTYFHSRANMIHRLI